MENSLKSAIRPEVKAVLVREDGVLIGTHQGLYHLAGGATRPTPLGTTAAIKALGPWRDGGFIAVVEDGDGRFIRLCTGDGGTVETLPPLPGGDEAKSVSAAGAVLAGGKQGVYRLDAGGWVRVLGDRRCEVIGLQQQDGTVAALVKKQGVAELPALGLSEDDGTTWSLTPRAEYHDLVQAWAGGTLVSRWYGEHAQVPGARPVKEPITAATIDGGVVAMVAGPKLKLVFPGRPRVELKHPAFAEAEILALLGSRALVAGVQGALLVDLGDGTITDLFAAVATAPAAAKIKKLFALDAGRLLATATFGTFVTTGDGEAWQPAAAEWAVMDAEAAGRLADGSWYLACQRGLFVSYDNGAAWKHVKLTTRPHHFCELTGLAVVGNRLALASKAGLFIAHDHPKDQRWVPGLGRSAVTGLAAVGDRLLVGQAGGLCWYDPATGAVSPVEVAGPELKPLGGIDGTAFAVTKRGLFRLDAAGAVPVAPAGGEGDFQATIAAGRLLVWRGRDAWIGSGDGHWTRLAGWPAGIKNGTVLADGGVIATDRAAIYRLSAA